MTTVPARSASLRDVTLRDGLQLVGKAIPLERKLEIVRVLLDIGVPEIEIGSLARPDLVPAMADTLDLVAELTTEERKRCWLWVATPRHVEQAAAAGAVNFQYCLSVSNSHNQANIGRDTEDSIAAMPAAIEIADSVGGRMQLCLATAFTCPFDGPVDPYCTLDIIGDPRTYGSHDIVLCDTLGQAIPSEVDSLVRKSRALAPQRRLVFHGHDTWGMGVANTLAAINAGVDLVDGALGGLGGCPFAPGASGNTSTEDILFATRPDYLDPSAFQRLVGVSEQLLSELSEEPRSRAAQGARSRAHSFPWVID